MNRAFKLCEGM